MCEFRSKMMKPTLKAKWTASRIVASGLLASFLLTNIAVVSVFGDDKTKTAVTTTSMPAFTTDLTQLGREGRLRENPNFENAISRLIEVLGNGDVRQPLIVDEKGERQDMIVEQLAIRIAKDEIPQKLKGIVIVKVENAVLFSNSETSSQVSQRINSILSTVETSKTRTVLFVNDVTALLEPGTGRLAAAI